MSNTPLLQAKNLNVRYGSVLAVDDVDIEVYDKEIVTIIGANGAGKSSILMSLSGIVKPVHGTITFDENDISKFSPKDIVELGIVQVPEGRRIFPKLTVKENLDLGAFLVKEKTTIQEDLDYVFELFPILKDRSTQLGGTLSGGEQQMLAIARALMQRPRVLFLDEPSLGLAPIIVQKIFEVFRLLRKDKGVTMLIVEQNVNLALKNSERVYVLENGKVAIQGLSKDLQNDKRIQESYLGGHVHE